jgi:DNA repair protein RecO (recombination protein O)
MPAFYLNELLLSLTARHDPHPEIFDHYSHALLSLRQGASLQRELRLFEKRLLDALGYGIPAAGSFAGEADPLGLEQVPAGVLASLAAESLEDPRVLEQVRPLLRRALALCLDGRGLRTRAVARAVAELQRARP